MYEEHPSFNTPPDGNVIWRYLDLAKFISVLHTSTLFSSQAAALADPYEGTYSPATRQALESELPRHMPEHEVAQVLTGWDRVARAMPHMTYVNCWHQSHYESAAMWEVYSRGGYGLAIRSTIGRLKGSVVDERAVYVGSVTYADYETVQMQLGNLFTPYLFKRRSFEFEKEVRLVFADFFPIDQSDLEALVPTMPKGIALKMDIVGLIDGIFIDPKSEPWVKDMVRSVVERYRLSPDLVHQSDLLTGPK